MNAIIPFAFEDNLVRVVVRDGEPWFVAKDVCAALGLLKSDTAAARLDEDEKGSHTVGTPGGEQTMTVISEAGLYRLMFTSRKAAAECFMRWLAHELIPSIRKTGKFETEARDSASEDGRVQMSDLRAQSLRDRVALLDAARWVLRYPALRPLWEGMGLPRFAERGPVGERSEARAAETFERILLASIDGRTVKDLLAQAANGNSSAAVMLDDHGIKVLEDESGIVVANDAPFLLKLFGNKAFWRDLRDLLNAQPHRRLRFGGHQSRGTFLPMADIEAICALD